MPEHRTYIEPYFGGGSVLLNKDPSPVEIAADLDWRLINFWKHLQGSPLLIDLLGDTSYDRAAFEEASRLVAAEHEGCVAAWAFLVNRRMSRGALGKDFAWSDRLRGKRRVGGPVPGDVNAWDTVRAGLRSVAARIQYVRFVATTAVCVVANHREDPDTLFYCDPPYLPEKRTVPKAYRHEMTRADHVAMLDALAVVRGCVLLSGYRNDLYDSRLAGWERHDFAMPNHSGQTKVKQKRTECLWIKGASR